MKIMQENFNHKFARKTDHYEITCHTQHNRLYKITLSKETIKSFLSDFSVYETQNLEYVPYLRFNMAGRLQELLGESFTQDIQGILQDRQSGGFTISIQGQSINTDDYVKFSTAISHLIGIPNHDSMSGTFYARFSVKDTDNSDSYLRQAYRFFTLHTDGTFVDEPTDWLLMMKMEERNAVGGESRLLHLDDWDDFDYFRKHPLASHKFLYKASPSKNVPQAIYRTTFYEHEREICICFIDQFAYPETIEQSLYLMNLSKSLESSPATKSLVLPIGEMIVINNRFWMHGRAAFEKHPDLHRELLRQRGTFANERRKNLFINYMQ
ncbi:glutarate dioxygenase GlaH [Paenibacillus sp. IITD108]|uniref:glutarate dioxygenase GlaH n=1 Tax=Paenibacillus sp. IITD108 TaxID=3116649 RepID=UPI002F427E03